MNKIPTIFERDWEGDRYHPDGRMAKIKARDFGLKRQKVPVAA